MANSLDFDGRGPTDQQLVALGATVLLIAGLITGSLLLKSTGRLNDYIRVVAELTNVGDGLPARSDVKYHGLLVGAVDNVVPAAYGKPNYVHINLKPEYAKDIPSAVTARVVPTTCSRSRRCNSSTAPRARASATGRASPRTCSCRR